MKEKLPLPSHVSEETRRLNPAIYAPETPAKGAQVQVACKEKKRTKPRETKQPNQTEKRFLARLQAKKEFGLIHDYRFEAITFKLADGLRYSPDITVWEKEGAPTLFIEVKGGGPMRDDSIAKFKMARELHKWARFELWRSKSKKEDFERIY